MKGAHVNSQITALDANQHFSLIVSGSMNGEIAFWDYQFCFLDGLCKGHLGQVSDIKFVNKRFPACVSAGNDGILCIWATREAFQSIVYTCIARIENQSPESFPISSIIPEYQESKFSCKVPELNEKQPLPNSSDNFWKFPNLRMYKKMILMLEFEGKICNQQKRKNTQIQQRLQQYHTHKGSFFIPNRQNSRQGAYLRQQQFQSSYTQKASFFISNRKLSPQQPKKSVRFQRENLLSPTLSITESTKQFDYLKQAPGIQKSKVNQLNQQNLKQIKQNFRDQFLNTIDSQSIKSFQTQKPQPRHYIWLADQLGRVRKIDISYILQQYYIDEKKQHRTLQRVNVLRRDNYDGTKIAETLRRKQKVNPPLIKIQSLLIKQWKAHDDGINSLKQIPKPQGFITTSVDKHVKLWSKDGELWGDIYVTNSVRTTKAKFWKLPINWNSIQIAQISKVKNLIQTIEEEKRQKQFNQKEEIDLLRKNNQQLHKDQTSVTPAQGDSSTSRTNTPVIKQRPPDWKWKYINKKSNEQSKANATLAISKSHTDLLGGGGGIRGKHQRDFMDKAKISQKAFDQFVNGLKYPGKLQYNNKITNELSSQLNKIHCLKSSQKFFVTGGGGGIGQQIIKEEKTLANDDDDDNQKPSKKLSRSSSVTKRHGSRNTSQRTSRQSSMIRGSGSAVNSSSVFHQKSQRGSITTRNLNNNNNNESRLFLTSKSFTKLPSLKEQIKGIGLNQAIQQRKRNSMRRMVIPIESIMQNNLL